MGIRDTPNPDRPIQDLLRQIPKVDLVLAQEPLAALEARGAYSHGQVLSTTRNHLDDLRKAVLAGQTGQVPDSAAAARAVAGSLERVGAFRLRPVVNATGVVLHTNLGRAPLGPAVASHLAQVAQGYGNLEYDLSKGERGSRYDHVEDLLCQLSGAESALVVNNNASAVFLMLDALCKGQGVAISRGELVEIGGSFRIPDILAQTGARLVEVGTTNKTHPADYRRALEDRAVRALLKVHASNFVIRGFTQEVPLADLVRLARQAGALALYDAGALPLVPLDLPGQDRVPSLREVLATGVDLVAFSGDKLAGSAQAGILAGRRDLIDRIKGNPLTRMVRIDKLSLSALEADLQLYRDPDRARTEIPVLRMLDMTAEECRRRAEALEALVEAQAPGLGLDLAPVRDEPGGGSLPDVQLDGWALAVSAPGLSADGLLAGLRTGPWPVVGRIAQDRVLLSVRTLMPGDDRRVALALAHVVGEADASVGMEPSGSADAEGAVRPESGGGVC